MNNPFGYPPDQWSAAKDQARKVLIGVAKQQSTIAYSELVPHISAIPLDAYDVRLNTLLGQLSEDEDAAGRGMLSVLVVHKEGDQRPGPGFFEWAEQLGYKVTDADMFWIEMLKKVHAVWSKKSGRA